METKGLERDVNSALQETKLNTKNILKSIGDGVLVGTIGAHFLPLVYLGDDENILKEMRDINHPKPSYIKLVGRVAILTTVAELSAYTYSGQQGSEAYLAPLITNVLASYMYLLRKFLDWDCQRGLSK